MSSTLVAWIGNTDLRASGDDPSAGIGPIAQAIDDRQFAEAHLLNNYAPEAGLAYRRWLEQRSPTKISVRRVSLKSPTDYGEIYEAAVGLLEDLHKKPPSTTKLAFHLSPGTPAMAAVWILLSKTRYPAELIESSRERGVVTVSLPFDISAEFLPSLFRGPDERLATLSAGLPPQSPEFSAIVHRSPQMKRVIAMARRVAPRSVPVLIEGESGTGKELLARAVHKASPRSDGPFVAVNCGAIPRELFESEFFGHEKGAFTGASAARSGHVEQANGGTLFLDEVGELPLSEQVKLLRVLQEREVTRVGASKAQAVDVRVISATNRELLAAVVGGEFREDLYYRLAVAVVAIPPIREREGDLGLLIEKILEQVNRDGGHEPGYESKKISSGAKNLMLQHRWPGNVRELVNVISRAAIWSSGATITTADMADALSVNRGRQPAGTLNLIQPVVQGIDLPALVEKLKRHYLQEALRETDGNKTKAAKILGLPNYQTLSNWMKSCGLE